MTFYARKVEYAACDGEMGATYIAIIEFTRKNGCRDGIIQRRVLYMMRVEYATSKFKYWIFDIPKVGSYADYWIDGKNFIGWESVPGFRRRDGSMLLRLEAGMNDSRLEHGSRLVVRGGMFAEPRHQTWSWKHRRRSKLYK